MEAPLAPFEGGILKSQLIMQVHDEVVFDIYP
jgi:DNA polymerase I-like protein with 3'-5' exonuclease and polymerase domains